MRAAVVLTGDGNVALIRRRRAGAEYYLFPGGGVESGESAADAAAREAKEELGLDVRIERLVATVQFNDRQQLFFAAVQNGGLFGTGGGEEMSSPETDAIGSYEPVWISITVLETLDVRPRAVARLVAASAAGWLPTPIEIREAS